MIKVYLAGIPAYHEADDMEIRYRIYSEGKLVCKNSIFREYKKPAVVNLISLITLLKELKAYEGEDIIIIVNDDDLNNQIGGKSRTNNKDILKAAALAAQKIKKLGSTITLHDISKDKTLLNEWNQILKN